MSKKEGIMPFRMHPTPAKGKDGKILYYPRPFRKEKISMAGLDEYCAKNYGMKPFELTRAFDIFIQATGNLLAEGYRINTPIGSFAPRLKATCEITDPDDVNDSDVRFDGVEYSSGKRWHKAVKKWLNGFCLVPETNTQVILTDQKVLEAKMHECTQRNGYVTVSQFGLYTGLTYYSAKKLLDGWTKGEKPKLLKTKRGQEYIYTEI